MGALADKVREAGVVGAGGAGFPTHVKYQASVEYVIANGAECEPLLYCDQTVMSRYSDRIVEGLSLVMKEVGAGVGIIALKKKYREAIESLQKAISGRPSIRLHLMDSFYPAGDEQVLVYEVLGRVVPEGGIPLHVGVVVNNVATLINVANAAEGIPVTRRWLTVHGEVRKPSTLEVAVGTSIRDVVEKAGGFAISDCTILVGGPMMGAVQQNADAPVTKTTSGILVLPTEHPHMQRKLQPPNSILLRSKAACDQCMHCTELCPRYLLGHNMKPHLIMRSLPYGIADSQIATSTYLCCECGVCTYYACPLFLSPGLINAMMKSELSAKRVKSPHKRTDCTPFQFRTERKIPTGRLIERLGLARYDYHTQTLDEPFVPGRVVIPLKQHLGAPAQPVVEPGMKVREGQLIGEIPSGALSARVHASISGYVMSVGDSVVIEAE
jgi:RnfABCDGE-type electron transport complex C subunit